MLCHKTNQEGISRVWGYFQQLPGVVVLMVVVVTVDGLWMLMG